MDSLAYSRSIESAKVIQVIEIKSARGSGKPEQPVRIVTEYWSLDGKALAENDPYFLKGISNASSNDSSEIM